MTSVTALMSKMDGLRRVKRQMAAKKEARRALADLKGGRARVVRSLFGKQREMALSPDRRIVAHPGRRAGKTRGVAARAYLTGTRSLSDPGIGLMITSSVARTEKLFGTELMEMSREHRLGIVRREVNGEVYYILPNGHAIWMAGCKDRSEVEKFRGRKYLYVAIDECQGLIDRLEPLVLSSIEPALLDRDGWLSLTGTPNVQMRGSWYDFCTKMGFTRFHWDCRDNPHVKSAEWLATTMARYQWTENTPVYMREYRGIWCNDTESLCYPWTGEKNWIPELPAGEWNYSMGVDIGINEPCAWVIGAHRYGHPFLYLVHCEYHSGMSPTDAARKTIQFKSQFGVRKIVVDTGGIGAAFTKEWAQRFSLNVIPARKPDKAARIALMAGEIGAGRVKTVGIGCRKLEDEWSQLPWDDDRAGHHPAFADHLSDAALYLCGEVILREIAAETREPEKSVDEIELEQAIEQANRLAKLRAGV